jgi:hypothetical protein
MAIKFRKDGGMIVENSLDKPFDKIVGAVGCTEKESFRILTSIVEILQDTDYEEIAVYGVHVSSQKLTLEFEFTEQNDIGIAPVMIMKVEYSLGYNQYIDEIFNKQPLSYATSNYPYPPFNIPAGAGMGGGGGGRSNYTQGVSTGWPNPKVWVDPERNI